MFKEVLSPDTQFWQVEDELYRIPAYLFEQRSDKYQERLKAHLENNHATWPDDKNPILLDDVKTSDFDRFLLVLMPL